MKQPFSRRGKEESSSGKRGGKPQEGPAIRTWKSRHAGRGRTISSSEGRIKKRQILQVTNLRLNHVIGEEAGVAQKNRVRRGKPRATILAKEKANPPRVMGVHLLARERGGLNVINVLKFGEGKGDSEAVHKALATRKDSPRVRRGGVFSKGESPESRFLREEHCF